MKILWLILLLSIGNLCNAQKVSKQDSLLNIFKTTEVDSIKIKILYKLSSMNMSANPEQALIYTWQAIHLGEEKNIEKFKADLYYNLGVCYNFLGKSDSALILLNQCFELALKEKNLPTQVSALSLIGNINTNDAKYEEAATILFKGLKIAETSKDSKLAAGVYSAISTLYYNQADYSKAINYGEKSLEIYKKSSSPLQLGSIYLNIGLIYADSKNYSKAENYYQLALKNFEQVDAKLYIATTYGNLGILRNKSLSEKIKYLLSAQKVWDALSPDYPNAVGNLGNIGIEFATAAIDSNLSYLKVGEVEYRSRTAILNRAAALLKEAYDKCKTLNFDRDLHYFAGQLASVEEARGNFKLANSYLHEYITLNDSIYSQDNKNKIATIEGQREVLIRDKQIELNNISLAAQRKQRIALIIGLALLFVIGGLLYWQSRTRKKTNTTLLTLNNELDEANKVKTRYFGIISHDLRSPVASLITFLNLQKEQPELFSAEAAAAHQSSIASSASALLQTMEDMLQWSKSQMEHFKPTAKTLQVADLFDNLRNNFSDTADLQITFFNPSNLQVITDEDYLKTILQNLTANAINALQKTRNGKIEWKAFEENGKTILSVTDNGPGVEDRKLNALYDEQAAVNSKNGLGLHLIRDLAKAIGCAVSHKSAPGIGTTFQLAPTVLNASQ